MIGRERNDGRDGKDRKDGKDCGGGMVRNVSRAGYREMVEGAGASRSGGVAGMGKRDVLRRRMLELPVARWPAVLLNLAASMKASDIHIEPMEEMTRVRFRVDGSLREIVRLPAGQHGALVSCIKLHAGLDIAELRLPQDGRLGDMRQGDGDRGRRGSAAAGRSQEGSTFPGKSAGDTRRQGAGQYDGRPHGSGMAAGAAGGAIRGSAAGRGANAVAAGTGRGDGGRQDVRVSVLPTIHGEKVVLRLLQKNQELLRLENMGFSRKGLALYRSFCRMPNGMVLITGPTGSGKTSTLYATLNEVNGVERNILTIEDPVECTLAGINQMEVNHRAGLTFAKGLRSILRQDPDIIMVGEIRDRETAEICVRAALTGHLVFSTLHTNSAAGAVTRLRDMGIPAYMVASAVKGVVAQRLVRRLCTCSAAREKGKTVPGRRNAAIRTVTSRGGGGEERPVFLVAEDSREPESGKVCSRCGGSGFSGRTAVQEILPVTPAMKELVMGNASEEDLMQEGCRHGGITMAEAGREKVAAGETTADEILRIVAEADGGEEADRGN